MIKVKIIFVTFVTVLSFCTSWAMAATHNTNNLSTAVYHAASAPTNKVTFPAENLHKTANLSYKVAGKRYYPLQKIAQFSETGRASYYGAQFHGRRTTSGEKFDQYSMTAAHPTLPIPSYARVTNLNNGKSVIVRINDRGPFHGNRVIDVSRAAAEELQFVRAGTAKVRVEQVLSNMQPVVSAHPRPANIYVDLQHFKDKQLAQRYLVSTMRHLKQAHSEQGASLVKVKDRYVVRLGPFSHQSHAETMKRAVVTKTI